MFKMEAPTPSAAVTSSPQSLSPNSPSSPPPTPASPPAVIRPCAGCKILGRRCADTCVLAPYFPPTEPAKFSIAHRVFGSSNIIKFLQDLPESQRADAVSSMVYEAGVRIRNPVYGCAGAICQLQKRVNELQAQLAKSEAEVVNMQWQQASLLASLCMEVVQSPPSLPSPPSPQSNVMQSVDDFLNDCYQSIPSFLEDKNGGSAWEWEPLWT